MKWNFVCLLICVSALRPAVALDPPGASEPDGNRDLHRRVSRVLMAAGFSARDRERNKVKAGHYFLHAGLSAGLASDLQGVIDAGHAAQGVLLQVEFSFPHDASVDGATVSPSGKLLCTWSQEEKTARVWSLETGRHVRAFRHPGVVYSAEFEPKEQRILTTCMDGAFVWQLDRDQAVGSFNPRKGTNSRGRPSWVAFHPNGCDVLVLESGILYLWAPEDELPARVFPAQFQVGAARIHSKTGHLITWGGDNAVRIWDFETKRLLHNLPHRSRVGTCVVHTLADGREALLTSTSVPGRLGTRSFSNRL